MSSLPSINNSIFAHNIVASNSCQQQCCLVHGSLCTGCTIFLYYNNIAAVPILKYGAVLLQDKSEADVERIKATVLLCYGYVTYHSPAK